MCGTPPVSRSERGKTFAHALVAAAVALAAAMPEAAGVSPASDRKRLVVRSLPEPPLIERVSLGSDGKERDEYCEASSISADGRFVAFDCFNPHVKTGAAPLNPGDIWIHDRQSGLVERVSEGATGPASSNPSISADGRIIVFMSGDRATRTVFVRDRAAGTLTRVPATRAQPVPRVSGDGETIAFADYIGLLQLVIHELRTGATTTKTPAGAHDPALDREGRLIAFATREALDPTDHNEVIDIYVLDRSSNEVARVSVATSGSDSINGATNPSISADGRFVAFEGYPVDPARIVNVFVHDRLTQETSRISIAADDAAANGDSYLPSVSARGRYVAFGSRASNLVAGDTNGMADVFVRDRLTGRTIRVSVAADGAQSDGNSGDIGSISPGRGPSLSADGRFVAFSSDATNLVAGDGNGRADIFVAPTGLESDLPDSPP